MILYDGIFSLHFPWNSHFCGSFLPFSLLPSGKLSHNHGNSPCSSWVDPLFLWPFSMENHHVQWVNPLFRLGHVQVRKVLNKTRGYSIIYPINPIRSHWIPCCSHVAPENTPQRRSVQTTLSILLSDVRGGCGAGSWRGERRQLENNSMSQLLSWKKSGIPSVFLLIWLEF